MAVCWCAPATPKRRLTFPSGRAQPSGVICEIMKDDGTMARMDDLVPFARRHGLKIGTIRDLIAYRRRHDHLVQKVAEVPFTSDYGGDWRVLTYRNKVDGTESLVLQKGQVARASPRWCASIRSPRLTTCSAAPARASARCSARWTRSVARAPG
jgi:hypothetical protein